MFTRTKRTPTDDRMNPMRDPEFRPKMSSVSTPDFRRKVEAIIDRHVAAATATAEASSGTHLPEPDRPGELLQLNELNVPEWMKRLTISSATPDDSDGEDGDIW